MAAKPTHTTKHEGPEFTAFMRRILRSYGRRAGTDLELLKAMCDTRAELDAQIKAAAQAAHDNGLSWTEIGSACGVTRQAARQAWMIKNENGEST